MLLSLFLSMFSVAAGPVVLPGSVRFREPFLIGNVRAGVQSQALHTSRGDCRAVLLSERPGSSPGAGGRFENARVEGVYHRVLVAERVSASQGLQELQVECMVRLRDKTPLSEAEFLALLAEIGIRVL